MKLAGNILKIVFIAATVAFGVLVSRADDVLGEDEVVFVTQYADGTTNTWTKADLVAALGLMNRKYHRDCRTTSGRASYHGNLVKEIIDEDAETKTQVYEDGTTFTATFRVVKPAEAVAEANKNLATTITNGVPVKLAEARLRRVEEIATTNIVNVEIRSGE